MLGTPVLWTATVQNAPPGELYDYQFSVALQGQNQIVRDFNTPSSFTWVPWTVEGTYAVSVVVRDITQQPYIVYPPVSAQYVMQPWVTTAGGSAVNKTGHPLVALFSAGPCTAGHSVRVRFHAAGVVASSITNSVPCSQNSANFLVAGMAAFDSIPDALGGIRPGLRRQLRPRPDLHDRTASFRLRQCGLPGQRAGVGS